MAVDFGQKLLYIVVTDAKKGEIGDGAGFRYTRSVLQSTLQLMGCKARHAFKISRRVFEIMKYEHSNEQETKLEDQETLNNFELYKKQTTIKVLRDEFVNVVCDALASYKYVSPNQRADFLLACKIRERKESVTILLCGTSGCGKSTLSALLGSRLGITNVISTDSIRHMMRSFTNPTRNPLLYASTYHAGDCLDPVAVSQAKAKRKAKKHSKEEARGGGNNSNSGGVCLGESSGAGALEMVSKKQMAIEGYKAQSEMVIESLDRLITSWEERKESVVVEGVHLSLNFVMGLMKKHPSIIPFMIYITNESKHMERFAVRAKYMTLDPAKNKYIKYIRNIRSIQDYLASLADKHLVPKINNTNVDRSVAAIHATVFSCLRRRDLGENMYDLGSNTVPVLNEEYERQCSANSLSSKGVLQIIKRKGSERNLMALLNDDGSVKKAWNVTGNNDPLYGPLQIWRQESVNLQFGSFGLSAWPSDEAGTSNNGSVDGNGTDTCSRYSYFSSCCSSPKMSESHSKELMDSVSVSESGDEEEVYNTRDPESDEDLSDLDLDNEMEGSVDEDSTKSDEEYDDLAMQDDEEDAKTLTLTNTNLSAKCKANNKVDNLIEKYRQGFDLALS